VFFFYALQLMHKLLFTPFRTHSSKISLIIICLFAISTQNQRQLPIPVHKRYPDTISTHNTTEKIIIIMHLYI